jgi:ribosomal protein S18 acetylase RimI-like enzyme
MIQKLNWDSDFFGFEIGELIDDDSLNDAQNYKLIILKNKDNHINNFENTFTETKVVFSKKLVQNEINFDVLDVDNQPLKASDLYPLAYESGKYSRFLLDKNFEENQFKELYKKWIDNSLNKQFADKIFYIKESDIIVGFVSIKKHESFATIGLIAVNATQQGKGIGKKLIQKAENYCAENAIFELRIPTQKENIQACNFYKKNDYTIFEETIIKHYWKI